MTKGWLVGSVRWGEETAEGRMERMGHAEDVRTVAGDIAADTLAAKPEIASGIKQMCL